MPVLARANLLVSEISSRSYLTLLLAFPGDLLISCMIHEQPDHADTAECRHTRPILEASCRNRMRWPTRLSTLKVLSGLFLATALPEKLGRVKIFATGEVAFGCV
jgi:hypothetical protein